MLAVQGDFEAHARALERLGARTVEVRRPAQLDGPRRPRDPRRREHDDREGLAAYGLEQPIRDFAAAGRPVLGTCAGLIMLDRAHLGLMDIEARRNAFGRQVRSFEAGRARARASATSRCARSSSARRGSSTRATASRCSPRSTATRSSRASGNMLVAAFHPELTDDLRLHALFLALAGSRRQDVPARTAK